MSNITQIECSFDDWNLFNGKGYLGCSYLTPIDDHLVLASSWLGRCFVLDLHDKTCTPGPSSVNSSVPLAGNCLLAPSVARLESDYVCAVAAQAAWAFLWHLKKDNPLSIYPAKGGSVNAVALHPSGKCIALGTGYYSLNSSIVPKARVEIWTIDNPPQCIGFCCIPGVSVDSLAWDQYGHVLLAVSGDMHQRSGHVLLLDGESLCVRDMAPLDFAMNNTAVFCLNEEMVLLAPLDKLEIRQVEDLAVIDKCIPCYSDSRLIHSPHNKITQAALFPDAENVILNTGLLINFYDRNQYTVPILSECTGVAVMPDGNCLGITSHGVVRIWHRPMDYF